MCVCTSVQCICTCAHLYECASAHLYKYTSVCVYICTVPICMCVCTSVRCICMCVHLYSGHLYECTVRVRIYPSVLVHICMCAHLSICICPHLYLYVCTSVRVRICTSVHVHICTCTHVYSVHLYVCLIYCWKHLMNLLACLRTPGEIFDSYLASEHQLSHWSHLS